MKLDPDNPPSFCNTPTFSGMKSEVMNPASVYEGVLKGDPKNRYALEAMGYIRARKTTTAAAEGYFNQMASDYPDDYVPYLALGDLYTSTAQFDRANASYEQAFKRAPRESGCDCQRS